MNTSTAQQVVTDELRHWIVAQAEAGCRPEDVLAAMVQSGWNEDVAIAAMERTLNERLAQRRAEGALPTSAAAAALPATAVPLGAATDVPEPLVDRQAAVLNGAGQPVRLLSSMLLPRVYVFGQLLSDAECEGLIELSRPRLARSETVDNATGGSEVNVARTSDGMFFERGETALIKTIEERIAALVRWPVSHGEGLQILRYRPGAEYKPHHDYFDLKHPGSAKILERGGQRVGTLVMYLNAPEGGGATTFPDVGFEVAPVRGNAVFFTYDRAHVATRTLHGGAPVTAGEKWVATKWLRQGVFV
jgi:prolyl 4-hydroxylase